MGVKAKQQAKKFFALGLILVLGGFLAYVLSPYITALFGALILFILVKPLYLFLLKKCNCKKGLAATISIFCVLLIIILPFAIALTLLIGEAGSILSGAQSLINNFDSLNGIIPEVDVQESFQNLIASAETFLQQALVSTLGTLSKTVINLVIMFFCLFYLLINSQKLSFIFSSYIPYDKKNQKILGEEFANVTYSVVISTGVIAVMQGILLALGFLVLGIDGALFWGFITVVLSFLPVVGPTVVWVPAGIIMLLLENYVAGVGILIWGFILSNVDNFIRPMLQRKVGKMHPLVSLIGVFIGLPVFGILGLVIGPLLLSYFSLLVKMFKEEYL